LDEIYKLCETLLETRSWGETTIAYQVIFDNKKMFNEDTFDIFEKWLYQYIEDWWDCDDFMTHAFQYLLMQYPKQLNRVKSWVSHEKFAVRRSAAVILIRPAQKGLLDIKDIITISELLIDDPHYLVQKGVGWLLKESTKYYHDEVVQYLEHNVKKMTRTTFRYALEKLPKEEKEQLMFL
jgi:3-methyladenine DNA glycosylase AlkD